MAERFAGKTILITGAGGDIGGAVARRFAREGAVLALTDVDADKLSARGAELEKSGAQVVTAICDVRDFSATQEMVAQVAGAAGKLDMLFNNAGFQGAFNQIHTYPAEDFKKVIEINLVGAFHVLRAVAAHMVQQRSGAIVNTASMAGVDGPPNMAAYASSKWGIIGLTSTAAKDLAPYNIRVNAISPAFMGPGFMWTRQVELQAAAGSQYYSGDPSAVANEMIAQVPMRRYGSIEEIPGVVAFLMSDDASYLTGVNVPISGGIR